MNQQLQWVFPKMAITFTTTTSSASVTVNDPNHGAGTGSFVTFSNANTGNNALNTKLNNEFSITLLFLALVGVQENGVVLIPLLYLQQ